MSPLGRLLDYLSYRYHVLFLVSAGNILDRLPVSAFATSAQFEDASPEQREQAILHQIQRLLHERVRFGPIWQYIWPSGVGPRVAEPALMLIDPYPWSAPLEEVRLK